jgi:RNA polymerase sigma factor (sigma-70 family)
MMLLASEVYFEENGNHIILTRVEEKNLLVAAQGGNLDALQEIARHNQRLVMSVVKGYHNTGLGGDQEWIDLVQWGNVGLMQAIQKWDSQRGLAFSTYAVWWIRQYVRRYGVSKGQSFYISFREAEITSQILYTRSKLLAQLERDPTIEEIASESHQSVDDVTLCLDVSQPIFSLDTDSQDDSRDSYDFIEDPGESPEAMAEVRFVLQQVADMIKTLPSTWGKVIYMRYGLEETHAMTYEEIGKTLGVSKSAIQQIEKHALGRLRYLLV